MRKIVEDGNKAFETVPCIVEAEGGSEALRELRLIYANSDTRRMSSADISKQAERVEALLYQQGGGRRGSPAGCATTSPRPAR